MIEMNVDYNPRELEQARDELAAEMERAIYDVADQIFAISQRNAPVDRGTLKKSGSVRYGRGYALIGYNTPYAETVHDGHAPHTRQVSAHRRVLMSGAVVSVRSHARRMGELTGRPYLDNAIRDVLDDLPRELRDSIDIRRLEVEY